MRDYLIVISCIVAAFLAGGVQHHLYMQRGEKHTDVGISNVSNATFNDTQVQFSEVTGKRLVCMVALHTRQRDSTFYTNMECVSK